MTQKNAFRPFTCDCGHRPRFGAARCNYCYSRTPLKNRKFTWVLAALAVLSLPVLLYLASR